MTRGAAGASGAPGSPGTGPRGPVGVLANLRRLLGAGGRDVLARIEGRLLPSEASPILEAHFPEERRRFRVLVPVANPVRAARVARVAATVAAAEAGEVMVLHVVGPEAPGSRQKPGLAVEQAVAAVQEQGVPVGFILRAAHHVGRAIRRTALEQRARMICLGWREEAADAVTTRLPASLAAVLEAPPADVAVVGGKGDQVPSNILVPQQAGEIHPDALRLARDLSAGRGAVTLLVVLKEGAPSPTPDEARAATQSRLEAMGAGDVAVTVVKAPDQASGMLAAVDRGFDGIVIAASPMTILDRLLFGRVQRHVARQSGVPVIVTKPAAGPARYVARRLWRGMDRLIPNLGAAERATVEAQISEGSRPDADFYVMIALASAIASFGLLMSSAAVIIGAMLVAPLLSAMVALGLGVVEGQMDLIRRAAGAVARGSLLAVAVGALVGLAGPGTSLGAEILARAQPNLFDLGVALAAGAAGAYAISRRDVQESMAGVAIAAAVIPPLSTLGIGLSAGSGEVALGALLLFLTNVVAIALAAGVTFLLLGFGPMPEEHRERQVLRRGLQSVGVLAAAVALVLGSLTWRLAAQEHLRQDVTAAVAGEMEALGGHLRDLQYTQAGQRLVVEAAAEVPGDEADVLAAAGTGDLEDKLGRDLGRPVELHLTLIGVRLVPRLEADPPRPAGEDGP
ncbi:MAG: DUF389 domain-containing protein [Anaerolineae bacterium]